MTDISMVENATRLYQWIQTNSAPVIKLSLLMGCIIVVIGILLSFIVKPWGSKTMITGFMVIIISGLVYLILNNIGPSLLNIV